MLEYTSQQYVAKILNRLGKGKEHVKLLYKEWMQEGSAEGKDPHFQNAGKLLEQISELSDFSYLPIVREVGEGAARKVLLATRDGLEVEMVLLPMKAGLTLCVSSQVGCKMGCAFCETGRMGLVRQLSMKEIVSQVFVAKNVLQVNVRNVAFMGMGEPLDNFENVVQAVRVMSDPVGLGIVRSHITLSTSGVVPHIYRLKEEDLGIH